MAHTYIGDVSARIAIKTMDDDNRALDLRGNKLFTTGLQRLVVGKCEVVGLWLCTERLFDLEVHEL